MKVAFVHYWLTNMRGGENVLCEISKLYPKADIFTHAYMPSAFDGFFDKHSIFETFIAKLPFGRKYCQKYLPLMPLALKKLDLSAYNLIISSESGPAKGFKKPSNAIHICYCHTPMRYLWDMYEDYYKQTNLLNKVAMSLFKSYLRNYDLKSAKGVDYFLANSKFVQERIKRIYNRDSVVIYPPVDVDFFEQEKYPKEDYYLFVGQLIPYKRCDLALDACLKLKRKIVVVGDGIQGNKFKDKYKDIAVFKGKIIGKELREIYGKAKALIFPGIEDFGIVPVEAQATGTPVIALGNGGALETVIENKTGIFFEQSVVNCLCEAILKFEKKEWDENACRLNARKFSKSIFNEKMKKLLTELKINE